MLKFLKLGATDKILFLKLLLLLPYKQRQATGRDPRRASPAQSPNGRDVTFSGRYDLDRAKALAAIVEAATRRSIIPVTCFIRSVALHEVLVREGLESQIRFGIDRGDTRFLAHAWVEHQGLPINDATDVRERYPVLTPPSSQDFAR
jgi:hypothetical protein